MNPRIASLVPSLTELLLTLGLQPWIVARTGYCIHPAELVGTIPKVGGTKTVNLPKLRRLAPTHVLVNVDENTREVVDALREFVPHVIVTHPCAPQDNLTLLDLIFDHFGNITDRSALMIQAASWREQFHKALTLTQAGHYRPQNVLYLIWRDPWITIARDTYISRMLATVNWHSWPDIDGGAQGASRYPRLHGDEIWLTQVQRVLLSSEPYAFGVEHVAQAQALCPQAQVQLVDGEALSWYGPRAVHGLQLLRELAAQDSVTSPAQ